MPSLGRACLQCMGFQNEALRPFEWMYHEGIGLHMITFVSHLAACSHACQVDEGLCDIGSMDSVCGWLQQGSTPCGWLICLVMLSIYMRQRI
jgi:hypothetical protein